MMREDRHRDRTCTGFSDPSQRSKIKDLVRDTGLQWQFSGDVRLHGLWLLCRRDRQCVLPQWKPIRIFNVVAYDLWGGLSDAAFGLDRAGGIHRSAWTPRRPPSD